MICVATLLQGCVNAAVTGAQVVYDRHNLTKTLNDHYITASIYRAIYTNTDRYKNTHVSIDTFNRIVLLTGQVKTSRQQAEITELAKKITTVREVYNLTTVSRSPSLLVQMSDAWITTKVKSQLVANDSVDPDQIKVVTESGTVYLMGILPPDQANVAIQIARSTAGVQKVIKVFSYLRESKV